MWVDQVERNVWCFVPNGNQFAQSNTQRTLFDVVIVELYCAIFFIMMYIEKLFSLGNLNSHYDTFKHLNKGKYNRSKSPIRKNNFVKIQKI